MVESQTIGAFTSGTHNLLPDEVIPQDAASSSLNWLTKDGKVELIYGRRSIGGDGEAGKNYGEHTGYKADGTVVRFRKVQGKVQYLSSLDVWTDIITGLSNTDVTFSNYQSLAGAFVYVFGLDGIYKIATANPGSYTSLYDAAKNFKGYGTIDKGRTFLWGREKDATGLYGSYIDGQDSTVYTTVTSEATTSLSGTLAFKAAGTTRTCFAVVITVGAETFTDNYNGVLVGSVSGTGTINYTTGAYTVSVAGAGTADYQWENSNAKGVTDFTKSATRLAGEGFIIRQDAGGDAIKVVIPFDGSYFSIKANSVYQFTLDTTDTAPTNIILRTDIGVNTLRSAIGTGAGILFMNTANPSKPAIHILKRNPLGDNFDITPLFPQFKWENYTYDDVLVDSWDKYVLVSCQEDSAENNRLMLADITNDTVDTTYYGIRTSTKANGMLYGGDPVSQTTYELFTGFDDNGIAILNKWTSRGELYGSDVLKKTKKYRFSGLISPDQAVEVHISIDDGEFQLVGTILGSGDYVNYSSTYAIGTTVIGTATVGGDDGASVYRYFMEIKVRVPKFRKRVIQLKATGIGYVSVETVTDFDIWRYQDKLPRHYRSKQNVSLDGATTDQDSPTY